MANIIAALPGLQLEYLPDHTGAAMLLVESSQVQGLIFSRSNLFIHLSARIPTFLISLDMSDSDFQGEAALVTAFGSLRAPIALRSLNVARSALRISPGTGGRAYCTKRCTSNMLRCFV